jgi:hypothetical protein
MSVSMNDVSKDPRLRIYAWLLLPALVGHFIQLLGEDMPWAARASLRYWNTPGWHLWLPPWVPYGIAAGLGVAVIGLAIRRRRAWMVAVIVLYVGHYLSWPFRIRNHMSHMLFTLLALGGVWLLGRRSIKTDRTAVNGIAAVLCVTYFFAALHKTNDHFLSFDPALSSAVEGLTAFHIYGDLGSQPSRPAIALAVYGTVLIEALAPVIAWRVHKLRVPAILVLFAFHFPHVAVMNVADYPMIASISYVALFSPAHVRLVLRHARPNAWNVTGAALGVAAQLWFMPYGGALMVFGLFVCGSWGWAAGSMLRTYRGALPRTRAMHRAQGRSSSSSSCSPFT